MNKCCSMLYSIVVVFLPAVLVCFVLCAYHTDAGDGDDGDDGDDDDDDDEDKT